MLSTFCYGFVCFVPLDASTSSVFGFSEFLAGLALMVLAWTIADVRYHFRVRTTPLPLQGITFAVVTTVGILTLLTDLWRAEGWLVPRGNVLTPSSWQALLGGIFLLTFLTWTWFAFIRPPVFGKRNAKRYARALFRTILKGSPSELSVIADELTYSARSLIRHAPNRGESKNALGGMSEELQTPSENLSMVSSYANDILLLIADRRFCRAIVESSPGTAWAVFREIGETKKYGIPVETFAKNIVTVALSNKDSFIFHEAEGYESGLIGYLKPLTQTMFSNCKMVEVIGTLLDPDFDDYKKWDATQWEVYCRVVLITFRDYVKVDFWQHSFVLYRAKGYIENAASDLYEINGIENSPAHADIQARLSVSVRFVGDAVKILEEKGVPKNLPLRRRKRKVTSETFYDHLANMIFEIIYSASAVRSPVSQCWWIQHNAVWAGFFSYGPLEGAAGRVVKFKVRRLLYDEIVEMKKFPNFKGARIIGFCLNILGLSPNIKTKDLHEKALKKVILSWMKKNYAWLHSYNARVAEACLVDGFTYEAAKLRLVRTYPSQGLRRDPRYVYFDVDPVPLRPRIRSKASTTS